MLDLTGVGNGGLLLVAAFVGGDGADTVDFGASDGPMNDEQLKQALRQLEQGQQSVQQALKELLGRLGEMGMGESGKQIGRAHV